MYHVFRIVHGTTRDAAVLGGEVIQNITVVSVGDDDCILVASPGVALSVCTNGRGRRHARRVTEVVSTLVSGGVSMRTFQWNWPPIQNRSRWLSRIAAVDHSSLTQSLPPGTSLQSGFVGGTTPAPRLE